MGTRSPFLNHIAELMLTKQYSLRIVDTYLKWISSYIRFHDKRNPASMDDNKVVEYLDYLVLKRNVSPKTQATALNALSFLYKQKKCKSLTSTTNLQWKCFHTFLLHLLSFGVNNDRCHLFFLLFFLFSSLQHRYS
ncbi:hypothetical protein CKO50_15130 [Pseudoalteromonas sp. HM-SA03]|uniref:site-specific integrase n=1 Tax=Pseudoalteromonas sp. HM-SA03 TaxID=2029678 RepID=UPI000BAE193B|nr:site-specific integrase [Pseudoalteromonas sp. HM-SA03]PAY00579.1 hypothetical protein CKO50_15130 [Pseudoalteromonas sp. HM-SA03]